LPFIAAAAASGTPERFEGRAKGHRSTSGDAADTPPVRALAVLHAGTAKEGQERTSLTHGQGTVEYVVLIASIGVVLTVAMVFLGGKIQDLFFTGDADSPLFSTAGRAV